MSLSPPEYIRHMLDEIDYILNRISNMDYESLAYGVTTKSLNQAIRRNADRFPPDFMFRLTKEEKQEVVTNCDHLQCDGIQCHPESCWLDSSTHNPRVRDTFNENMVAVFNVAFGT